MVSEGFRLARLVVGLPLELDEHGRGLLQVLVSILGSLEHDGELSVRFTVLLLVSLFPSFQQTFMYMRVNINSDSLNCGER